MEAAARLLREARRSRSSTRSAPPTSSSSTRAPSRRTADEKSRAAVRRRASRQPRRRDRRHRLLGPGRARRRSRRSTPRRASSATTTRPRSSPSSRRCCGSRRARRRPAPARRRPPDAVRRRGRCRADRRHRRRPRLGRADARVRQGPGRLLVLLHLLHHPAGPRPRAVPRSRRPSSPTSAAPSPPATARSCSPGSTSAPTTAAGPSAAPAAATLRSALTLAGLVRRILDETAGRADPPQLDRAAARRRRAARRLVRRGAADAAARPPAAPVGRRRRPAPDGPPLPDAPTTPRSSSASAAAIPGVAVHADVIAGFPTEDDAAFARSLAFIRSLDLAGLHVFRYSARPGTPATRMAGQVDERTKKARAAELLAVAADARAAFARRRASGPATRVLVEQRLPTAGGSGHAADHVLVAVTPRPRDDGPRERDRHGVPDGDRRRGRGPCRRRDPRGRPPRRARCAARSRSRCQAERSCALTACSAGSPPARSRSTIVHDDDLVLAFRDINPRRPTHVLVIPSRTSPRRPT